MKFCVLRSGSSGNCTLIEHDGTAVLLDAASSSLLKLEEILAEVAFAPSKISAVVVSHLHGDHVNASTVRLCAKYQVPFWTHRENAVSLRQLAQRNGKGHLVINPFDGATFNIGSLRLRAFDLPHDANGITSGFRIWTHDDEIRYISYAADLGIFGEELVPHFAGAAAILLECNHDVEMLKANPRRHESNKHRVLGAKGHLSNEQCADALVRIFQASANQPPLVILAHLSGDHNTPEMALTAVSSRLGVHGFNPKLLCAGRGSKTEFISL